MVFGRPCPNCGANNPASARFCNTCGAQLRRPGARQGCLRRLLRPLFWLLLAGVVIYFILGNGSLGRLSGNMPWTSEVPETEGTPAGATPQPSLTGTASAAETASPSPSVSGADTLVATAAVTPGLRAITYAVSAGLSAADAVHVVYVDTGGRPAETQVALPWQHTVQLAPGVMARIVVEGSAAQPFTARITVGDHPACEAAGTASGGGYRAQCEAAVTR